MTSRPMDPDTTTCPDCGRAVRRGAQLCECGFPLLFLESEEPPDRPLKPTRRPRGDDDTDELPPVPVEAPAPAATAAATAATVPADPASLTCRNCAEQNDVTRTWCAKCGARLRELAPVAEPPPAVAPAAPRRLPVRAIVLTAGAVLVLLALVGAGLYAFRRDNTSTPPPASAGDGPLTIVSATATATAGASTDDSHNPVNFVVSNVLDGNLATAWRAKDTSRHHRIVLTLDRPRTVTGVALVPGYAKRDSKSHQDRFSENHTVTGALWSFDDGSSAVQKIPDPQPRWFEQRLARATLTRTVTLEVISTGNPRAKHATTAISDIRVVGR